MSTYNNALPGRIEPLMQAGVDVAASFWMWPGYLLFFLMLAFPAVLSVLYIKAFLFGLVIILVGVRAMSRLYVHLHLKVVVWTLALAVVSLFFCFRGMFLGSPGAVKCVQVYVVWPLIYLILLDGVDRMRRFQGIESTLIFSSMFIGAFGIVCTLSRLNILPEIPYLDSLFPDEDLGIGVFEGYTRMEYPGLTSMPFLVPFLVALLVIRWSRRDTRATSMIWVSMALVLNSALTLLSGRRALQLVTILAPLLTLVFSSLLPVGEGLLVRRSLRRAMVAFVLGIVILVPLLGLVYSIDLPGLADRFSSGFDFSPTSFDDSPDERRQQYFALMNDWHEHPLIGAGLGASAYGSIRSETMPWSYELYYLALLFQTGIVGFASYMAGIVWVFWSSLKVIKRGGVISGRLIPVLVGMLCFLIAAGTNPYLARFDGIWVIFLPLAFINHSLLTSSGESSLEFQT